ncbi:hypothetical protein BD413DRAFT_495208 [Trametes elegans]|nr:hypothetical protein BD413DRAFT_495208 [Trametes elegans]
MHSHRALSVPEILDEVFLFFAHDVFDGASPSDCAGGLSHTASANVRTSTLLHAACVCRAFHKPAIRVLWRDLHGVYAIFALLPSLVEMKLPEDVVRNLSIAPIVGVPRIYVLPPYIAAHEWDQLQEYASHVQSLVYDGYDMKPMRVIAPHSWWSLQAAIQGRCLLPNLCRLQWRVVLDQPRAITSFLGPSLQVLLITCDYTAKQPWHESRKWWAKALDTFCKIVFERALPLRKINVDLEDLSPTPVMAHLPQMETLREFSLSSEGPLELPHVRKLAQMPSLEILQLPCFVDGDLGLNRLLGPSFSPFPRLRQLTLSRHTPEQRGLFPCPTLQVFSVETHYRDVYSLRDCFGEWAQSFPTLRDFNFSIVTTGMIWSRHVVPPLLWVASPLLSITTLQHVSIRGTFPTDDAAVAAFAEAWPSLTHLSIVPHIDVFGLDGSVGLPGLLALRDKCAQLAVLRLPRVVIDAVPGEDALPPAADHPLQLLAARCAALDEAARALLQFVFPRLRTLE